MNFLDRIQIWIVVNDQLFRNDMKRPSQIKLSNCIKELAKLIIEFEQLIKSSTLYWDKRLRIALLLRKINYLGRYGDLF